MTLQQLQTPAGGERTITAVEKAAGALLRHVTVEFSYSKIVYIGTSRPLMT